MGDTHDEDAGPQQRRTGRAQFRSAGFFDVYVARAARRRAQPGELWAPWSAGPAEFVFVDDDDGDSAGTPPDGPV